MILCGTYRWEYTSIASTMRRMTYKWSHWWRIDLCIAVLSNSWAMLKCIQCASMTADMSTTGHENVRRWLRLFAFTERKFQKRSHLVLLMHWGANLNTIIDRILLQQLRICVTGVTLSCIRSLRENGIGYARHYGELLIGHSLPRSNIDMWIVDDGWSCINQLLLTNIK